MLNSRLRDDSNIARVLIFNVDDGNFCIHLDWVEAVYQRSDTPLHSLKAAGGQYRRFLIHRGQPAWVLDLREAFGLDTLLGTTDRAAFAVVRAGSALLALEVDACTGVRDLDLSQKVPVPAALLRDGGFPVGHLIELDGHLHVLLEPSRIPSNALRDVLDPLLNEALAFRDRQEKLNAIAGELRRSPTLSGLKIYGRLSRRNGLPRTAAAVRTVVKAMENQPTINGSLSGNLASDTLLRDLAALASAQHTGELRFELPNADATLFFDCGRIADACTRGEWGRGALKEVLANREGTYRFAATDAPVRPQRIDDATLWVLVEAIEQLAEERRGKHLR
ncbi:MAG: chemotaxis protein CheW [Deltaproteobacteria bacterium]|nr:chemotaxis protein CheW [Deltaproteobacteria bacterium]